MKTLSCLLVATAALGSLGAVSSASAGAFTPTAQVHLDVEQLVGDLQAIAERADIDTTAVDALEADLQLAISGSVKPSLDSVRQLAADALAALGDGKLSSSEELTIINDLTEVLRSSGFSDDEIDSIQGDIFALVMEENITQDDFQLILNDLTSLFADLEGTFSVTTEVILLEPPLLERKGIHAAAKTADSATIINSLRAALGAQASVGINMHSLMTGNYTVSVTTKSSGVKMALGPIEVVGQPGEFGVGAATFGSGGKPLPKDFDATDVDQVEISEEGNDTPVLSGNTAQARMVRSSSFTLNAGDAAPSVTGDVSFQTKDKPTGRKSSFLLFARKLPKNTKLFLIVNGQAAGKVKTDAKGQVLITAGNVAVPTKADGVTPKAKVTRLSSSVDVSEVQFVELDTADGQVAATGGFVN